MCKLSIIGLLVAASLSHAVCQAEGGAEDNADKTSLSQLRPHWNVGDRWVVETRTQPIQERRKTVAGDKANSVEWQFSVAALEKIGPREAYRIHVECLLAGPRQANATVWVDRRNLAIHRIQVRLPRPNGFHTVTESYRTASGQSFPVLGPLTALPLDLPVFLEGEKGVRTFEYEAVAGPPGAKAAGEVGFTCSVEQKEAHVQQTEVQKLLHREFAKNFAREPVVAVELKSHGRTVRQLWQAGLPWPVFSRSGPTQTRLVRVVKADAAQE